MNRAWHRPVLRSCLLKEHIRTLSYVCNESGKDWDRSAGNGAVPVVEGRIGWFQERQRAEWGPEWR